MKEYKIAKGWAIFIYIGGALLIALFSWLLIMPFIPSMKEDISPSAYWFLAPTALIMIALMVVGIIDTIKSKFVIDEHQIFMVSTFSNRQLMLDEIMGYRITDNYILIESNNKLKKTIKVSTYFEKKEEIIIWLSRHFPDLDMANANQEKKEILNNEEFGWNIEQREEQLNKAKKITTYLNWIGLIIGAWVIFFANLYEYAITASMIFPIICLFTIKYFKGLIRVDEKKDSAYPSVFLAILAPSLGLCLRAILDYNIFDYSNVWKPTVLIGSIYLAVLTINNKEFKPNQAKDYFSVLSVSLFIFAYAYGAVIALNCVYDTSVPEKYNAKIISKRIDSGKSTTYYLELTPWGYQKSNKEVTVTEELYNRLNKKNKVNIYYMKGLLQIPWFEVSE